MSGYSDFTEIERPSITIRPREYAFVCQICHKQGVALSPRANTHPGECMEERKRREKVRFEKRKRK